ncbi:MAG: V-type ATP synthase subunit E family protein [Clostridiales bacterium]|nr:V-type ATP synthase subunit E family protein [Clostridiales bacterium]
MGIDAITAKIAEDAAGYADGVISDAKKEAERIIADAEQEAKAIRGRAVEKAAKDSAVLVQRRQALAELEGRKIRLALKQEKVSCIMEGAAECLAGLKADEKIKFLAEIIARTGVREGELLLNAEDRKAIGKKLVKAANDQIKSGKIALSEDCIDANGGFILKYGTKEVNSTLKAIVDSVREETTAEVVGILFGE